MKLRYKLIGLAGVVVVIFLSLWEPTPTIPTTATTLRSDEVLKVTTTPSTTVIAKRTDGGKVAIKNVPNYGHGSVVTYKENREVESRPIYKGFSYDIGLTVDTKAIGIGEEFYFYKRFGLIAGSNFYDFKERTMRLHLFGAAGYRIPYEKLNNISVYIGYDTDSKIRGGLFLRFGNS